MGPPAHGGLPADAGGNVSLSADGKIAVVGGPDDNNGVGAAWVFARSRGVWSQQAKLVGAGAVGPASQGWSVSLSGDGHTAIVGGWDDNNAAGAGWVFSAKPVFAGTPGKADCYGQSVSALARQYGGLNGTTAALEYASVDALQEAIQEFCKV